MTSVKKFEKVFYYDFPIVKQYFWYKNRVGLRLTGHLVSGKRYHVDTGTVSTYRIPYMISLLVSWLDFGGRFGIGKAHKFDLRKL